MFKRKYKYFISYFFELDNIEFKAGSAYVESTKKLNKEQDLNEALQQIKEDIEKKVNRICSFICLANWKRLK